MSMKNILNEPEGSELSVMEVLMYDPWKHKNSQQDNVMFIVYKDKDHKKKVQTIVNPKMEIFFTKPEYRNEWQTIRDYVPMEKVYPVKVDARKVISTIHKEMEGATDPVGVKLNKIYDQAVEMRNFSARKEILKWPHTFFSDSDVQDYYRIMLGIHYNLMHGHIIDKAYLDIESDIYGLSSSEQEANLDKTNACTLIFNYDDGPRKSKPRVFTFLLRNHKRYPQQKHFEDNMDKFIKQCHDEFDHQTVIKNGKKKVIDTEADYHIEMFDEESDLLTAIFLTINTYRPDTVSVWNIAYDLPKLRARLEANGLNHVNVMCDEKFPESCRFVEMNIDNRADIDIADRKTFIKMTSTTRYLDQMQAYANIRKGRKAYGSNKLDNIANIELGMGKREFAKGIDVSNAAIKDYWNFVLYNIRDVWCQVLIDQVTNDTMTLIYDSNQTNCAIENLSKQTKYQKQIHYTWYLRKGVVPGNNPNNDYIRNRTEDYAEYVADMRRAKEMRDEIDASMMMADDDDLNPETNSLYTDKIVELSDSIEDIFSDSIDRKIRLQGGLVGNPDLNSANGTEVVNGVPSKHVFDDAMDSDYSSEYPWATYCRSICKSSQYGRLIVGERISNRQNVLTPNGGEKPLDDHNRYIPGAEFTADYISTDILSFGNVWFNLPTATEVDEMLSNWED